MDLPSPVRYGSQSGGRDSAHVIPEARRTSRKSARNWFMPAGGHAGAQASRDGFSEQVLGDIQGLKTSGEEPLLGEFANVVAGAARVHGQFRSPEKGGSGVSRASRLELRELERKRRVASDELIVPISLSKSGASVDSIREPVRQPLLIIIPAQAAPASGGKARTVLP